jgi:hypothetical protein
VENKEEPLNIRYARQSDPIVQIKRGKVDLKHEGEYDVKLTLNFELLLADWQVDDQFDNFPKLVAAILDKIQFDGHLKKKVYDYMFLKKSIIGRHARESYLP